MEQRKLRNVIIYAESTPNPATMKFVADAFLIKENATLECKSPGEAGNSLLARELFKFPFVKSVFISFNYITITKTDLAEWDTFVDELRIFIANHINSGKEVVSEIDKKEVYSDSSFTEKIQVHTDHAVPQNETEQKIVDILEEYIRPAVENDGGLIVFKSFSDGVVTVQMKGACSGCPSSTLTLKAGIEALLKRSIPEVQEVIAEAV